MKNQRTLRKLHFLFALTLAAAVTLAPRVSLGQNASPAPKYRVVDKILPPPGFPTDGFFRPEAMNAQGYVICINSPNYGNGGTNTEGPLVYKGNGQFIVLSAAGLPVSSQNIFYPKAISDVAADGSFQATGYYFSNDGRQRAVRWTVNSNGGSSATSLTNLVLPPDSTAPGEQGQASGEGVNSSGLVVGSGNSYRVGVALFWTGTTAQKEASGRFGDAPDVDEQGNILYNGAQPDGTPTLVVYGGITVPPPANSLGLTGTSGRAGRVIGYYSVMLNGTREKHAFLFSTAGNSFVTLPDFVDPRFPTAAPSSEARHMNAAGDIVGTSGPASVLWKRQADGSYKVFQTYDMFTGPQNDPYYDYDFNNPIVGIAGDGTLLVNEVLDSSGSGRRVSLLLRPSASITTPPVSNIATRLRVESGDNAAIAGFIVKGTAGTTKNVLIRGLGPSLAQYGVTGALADPVLELHDGSGALLVANDNWQSGDNASQIPSNFTANINSKDSIILRSVPVGSDGSASYTAVLKGVANGTGVALVEVYDLDDGSKLASELANIATRGLVQTGDNAIIAGVIVGGSSPVNILVRITGPTLKNFGITNALADPTLELHNPDGTILAKNDNWRDTQEADIIATKLQPSDNLESAIKATLAPGNYTAVARGKADTTGVGVVEVYRVP